MALRHAAVLCPSSRTWPVAGIVIIVAQRARANHCCIFHCAVAMHDSALRHASVLCSRAGWRPVGGIVIVVAQYTNTDHTSLSPIPRNARAKRKRFLHAGARTDMAQSKVTKVQGAQTFIRGPSLRFGTCHATIRKHRHLYIHVLMHGESISAQTKASSLTGVRQPSN